MAYKRSTRHSKKHGKYSSYKKRTYKRKTTRKGSFAKKVMKVVRKAETIKRTAVDSNDNACPNYGVASTAFAVDLTYSLSNIAQGNGQADREGNKIKLHKVLLRFYLVPGKYDSTYNLLPTPQEVRVVHLRNKLTPATQPVLTNIFQNGDSSMAPTGYLQDMMQPLNKDVNTIYKDKVFKVGCSSYQGSGYQLGQNYYANNDFKYNVKQTWDVTKHMPAHIVFNDTTAAVQGPHNFIYVLPVQADGDAGASSIPLRMSYNIEYQWTDF